LKKHKHNKNTSLQHQKAKWAIFTYSRKETKKITKLFKEAQIKVAFRTRNNKKHSKIPPANR
jgi:general stress protein 26